MSQRLPISSSLPARPAAGVLVMLAMVAFAACGTREPAEPAGPDASSAAAPQLGGAVPAEARELSVPAKIGSGQASLSSGPGGEVVLSWLEPDDGATALRYAVLRNGAFEAPHTVATGEDWLVSWADLPAVVPITPQLWAAHWLRLAPESVASYDIVYAVSADGGASFSDGTQLNIDGTLSEHGFVSWFGWDGDIGVVWLDGRRLAQQFDSAEPLDADAPPVGTSLRYARIEPDGTVTARGEIDELVCDCCRTSAAAAAGGPVVAYRDRSAEEVRDISVRRFAGGAWSGPVTLGPDGWRIEGCPVNGPALDAAGEHVVVAWFTAAGSEPRVRFARSDDGGASFGEPLEIDSASAFGHADVALLDGGDTLVSWWRKAEGGSGIELAVRRVHRGGRLGKIVPIAASAVAQPVDIPQMTVAGGRLVVAWTDAAETRVRSVEAPLP